jgi:hypothetical protein
MKNYAMLCALALTAILFAPQARADAVHEAVAMSLMDEAKAMAMSLLPNDETLILSKDRDAPGFQCETIKGHFVAYVVNGSNERTRYGCFHLTDDGVQIKWQDGEVTDTPMADVIVNRRRD